MHFSTSVIIFASALIPGVFALCEDYRGGHTYCKWYGTAPACGDSNFSVGDWDGNEQLKATTQRYSPRELLYYGDINQDCYDDYGNTCFGSSYKRLWCKSTPYPASLAQDHSILVDSTTGSSHQMKINIELN
ncbi:hypothetical protein DL98DRAFT_530418 [Cadophora sp. DSE1049]|nr:hypothetical protein DL98DRAFT_530418 [Cadophora sp. DSE1049]